MLHSVAEGDTDAFEWLFHTYHDYLGAVVYQLTSSRVLAEEITQETFMEVWLRRKSLRHIKSFKDFVFVVAKNRMLNALRKMANEQRIHQRWIESIDRYQPAEIADDLFEQYTRLMDEAISKLPTQQQKVFRMNKIARLKQREIASMLNISVETVKKHMKLAFKSIREYCSHRPIDQTV
ncbi:RNA polymerase sigma factor [Olivibacter ginsenosidimutans]|uniref:RNA polymerase sigma factor n=2 Tax=Olivibacter ginsenosidimutans TaxID=1176537 RepID=A0ABP9CD82_9SPHI